MDEWDVGVMRNSYAGSNRLMNPGETTADVRRQNPVPKIPGWVGRMPWSDRPDEKDSVSSVSISSRYIASMYFALNPLDNYSTDLERLLGIFGYLCTILINGCVAGVMSALFVGMSGDDRELNMKLRASKRWMVRYDSVLRRISACHLLVALRRNSPTLLPEELPCVLLVSSHYRHSLPAFADAIAHPAANSGPSAGFLFGPLQG